MKNSLLKHLLIILAIMLISNTAQAQQMAIKFNPLSLIASTGNIAVERAINKRSSIQLGLAYTNSKWGIGDFKTNYKGFAVIPEYRYYLTDKPALGGLFVAAFGIVQSRVITRDYNEGAYEVESDKTLLGGGINLGYQIIANNGFTLDFFTGPSVSNSTAKSTFRDREAVKIPGSLSAFNLRLGLQLGWSF